MSRITRILQLIFDKTGRSELFFHLKRRMWPILSFIARVYRVLILRKVTIIVVVGSLGKTSTTYAIRCVLGLPRYTSHQSNAWSALAVLLLKTSPFQKYQVIEVGIGNKGQMEKFRRLIKPNIVVVTSVASEHTGLIGTIENIKNEKAQMIRKLKKADLTFYNGDDENVTEMIRETQSKNVAFGFGEGDKVRCLHSELVWPIGMYAEFQVENKNIEIQTQVHSEVMLYPILAAVSIASELGLESTEIKSRLEGFVTPPGRMNIIQLKNGLTLIRDDYKATYETIYPSLEFLKNVPAKRKIVVFGDSIEMPKPWQESCRKIGEYIGEFADFTILVGKMEEEYKKGIIQSGVNPVNIICSENNWKNGFNKLPKDLGEGDVILVKALAFQRIQRFSLAILGEEINCERSWCEVRSARCENCGWRKENNSFYAQKTFQWELN